MDLGGGTQRGLLEQKDLEIKKLTEELELALWQHETESSIYLEVVGWRACEWKQVIDSLGGDFNRNQASCSFSGRTQKENLAFEDASPLSPGDFEGLKSVFRKPSPLKGLSSFSDQSVSSPGKAADPIYVVVRRNTQAAVEGFMVDIGESPSKRSSKEVISSLKAEVLDLRREKEQLIEHHTGESNQLEFEFEKERERMKVEFEQEHQNEVAELRLKLESQSQKEAEQMKAELNQKFQIQIADLQEELESQYREQQMVTEMDLNERFKNRVEETMAEAEQKHREKIESLQQNHEIDLANLQRNLNLEATKKLERKAVEIEQKFLKEIAALEEKLASVEHNQSESEVVTLAAEREELCGRVADMELHISGLQDKVTKLEGERSWLEERVPGLEKKLATEQSRLEDTVAGHAFERDQLKLIVSSHKNEQTKLENELAERKAERNSFATAVAMLAVACRNLKVSNQDERERWRSAYMIALKDMERALSRTQKQVKEERAQKGSAESDAQRMKAEIYTMQQESKDVWRHLERIIAEHISRAVGTSQQVEFGLCRKLHQQSMRFEAVQKQINSLLQVLRHSQMSEMDYLHTVENLLRAEQEVDILGDEVDTLVDLLEKVHDVMCQYAPVLFHYPRVAGVAKLIEYELVQRDLLSSVPA